MAFTALIVVGLAGASGAIVALPNSAPAAPSDRVTEQVTAGSSRCVEIPDAAPGDVAIINITNTDATAPGWGALRSSNATPVHERPDAAQYSSVNFAVATPPNPNLAIATVGDDRTICYDGAGGSTHVILDLFATIEAANIIPTTPTRLLDTRTGRTVASGSSRCVEIPDAAPGDVAIINITNTDATAPGWGALRSSNATPVHERPDAAQYSSVNFAVATPPNPNLAIATVGDDRTICYDGAGGSTHVILDLFATIEAANIIPTTPTRLLDTRTGRTVASGSSRCVEIPDAAPGDVAIINITNTDATAPGWGALRSSNATPVHERPDAAQYSSVNFAVATPPNPNLAIATVGDDRTICYDGAGGSTHVILDLFATIEAANIIPTTPTRLLDTRPRRINSLERVVESMTEPHDAYPHGMPPGFDWSSGPVVYIGNDPGRYQALIMWGIAYGAADAPDAPYQRFPENSRLQFRSMRVYILSELDDEWHVVQSSDGSRANARAYPENYAGGPAVPVPLTRESSGGSSGAMIRGRNLYFDIGFFSDIAQTMGGGFDPTTDIGGVFVTMQARMRVDDPTLPDDSADAKVLLYTGMDYWLDDTGSYCGWKCSNEAAAIGRAAYVTPEWQAFNMHTLSEAELRGNPPPLD